LSCRFATARSSARTTLPSCADFLARRLACCIARGCWHWTSDTYPADAVSLRAISSDNFVVVDITGDHQVIAEVSFTAALTTLHEKAIYLHEARQFQVEKLDYEGRKAYVRRVDSDYFTDAIDYTQVKELEEFESADVNGARAAHGDVRVNTQVVGFKKLKFYTMENIGAGNLSMPEQEMHTTAFWLHFPKLSGAISGHDAHRAPERAHGLAQVMRTVAALLLMCDPRDLGIAITEDISGTAATFEPDLFLFDNYPGGIGQSQPCSNCEANCLAGALEVLERCSCEAGCPACVGPMGEVGETGKAGYVRLLRELTVNRFRSADELVAFQCGCHAGFRGEAHNLSQAVQTHFVATFRRAGKRDHVLHRLADS
jgi:DEAD/DEAH box helicase domain-containing protein